MFLACAIWGLMSPVGKDAMSNGISGMAMVTFRATGGAVCFHLAALCARSTETVTPRDRLLFFFAGMLSIVLNQCCFTIGLSLTSPVNASIVTTTMPVITLVLAALFLKEPVTPRKVTGIALGATGALLLILHSGSSSSSSASPTGTLAGDLLCLTAQCCFATYLTVFKKLIQRYSVITCMKWMFTYAALVILPLSYRDMAALPWTEIAPLHWAETAFVVVGATFAAYLLMMKGQQSLCPTVVSIYNYVQPIVACLVSVYLGLGVFGGLQATAVVLIFTGVYLVTQSQKRSAAGSVSPRPPLSKI